MNYAQIRKMDVSDGEGIRVGLYVSGCLFNCENCYNKEVQSFSYGRLFTQETFQTLISYLKKDYISGLSLLGGDPLWQDINGLKTLINLCKKVHEINKTVWLWTGFIWEEIFLIKSIENLSPLTKNRQELIKNCDVVIDGPFIKEQKDLSLKWRGSANQRIIDVKKSLSEKEIILFDR